MKRLCAVENIPEGASATALFQPQGGVAGVCRRQTCTRRQGEAMAVGGRVASTTARGQQLGWPGWKLEVLRSWQQQQWSGRARDGAGWMEKRSEEEADCGVLLTGRLALHGEGKGRNLGRKARAISGRAWLGYTLVVERGEGNWHRRSHDCGLGWTGWAGWTGQSGRTGCEAQRGSSPVQSSPIQSNPHLSLSPTRYARAPSPAFAAASLPATPHSPAASTGCVHTLLYSLREKREKKEKN